MKVLFDCVVTQTPDKCSTTVQFVTLANKILGESQDVFIYWPVPDRLTEEELATYPKSDRIKYIKIHQYKDRMKEYNRVSDQMEELISFTGTLWDWDVLVTVRSTVLPVMRVISTSPRQKHRGWTRRIVLIEDMMVMSCKPTVAQSVPDVQDRLCLEAYLAADQVLMPAYHQTSWAVKIAKEHFAPATVRTIRDRIKEVCHLNLPEYNLKTKKFMFNGKRKLNVVFVGRMEKANARLATINEVFTNQFILRGEQVGSSVCTVSLGSKVFDTEITDVMHPGREEFWRICKEEVDLGIFFHVDVELNMSMLEPLCFGVPEIVKKAPWSVGMLGEDYPFYVSNETEAYAYVTAFTKDYAGMYAKFAKWFKEWFIPTYKKRSTEDNLYEHLMQFIKKDTHEDYLKLGNLEENEIVQLIAKHGGEELKLFDVVESLGKTELRTLADKLKDTDRGTRSLVFSTPWNDFRLGLIHFHGYEDAGVEPGHLRKKK